MISGTPKPEFTESYGVRADRFLVAPNAAQLTRLAQMIDAGQIKPFIDTAFPLTEAAKLHIHDETRRPRGKLVLSV